MTKPNNETPSSGQPTYGTLVVRLENALESIEFQRIELFHLRDELAASQAREAKLREALSHLYAEYEYQESIGNVPIGRIEKDFASIRLALPSDDSALKEAIKQGQREILLKAADFGTAIDDRGVLKFELRKMAEEIETQQVANSSIC